MANFDIKEDNTLPDLTANLVQSDGTAINLASVSTIRFYMYDQNTKTEKVNGAASVVTAAAGSVKYEWATGDTDTVGRYYGSFYLTYSNGKILTVPNKEYINIRVFDALNN
jgi:hypothetical protein